LRRPGEIPPVKWRDEISGTTARADGRELLANAVVSLAVCVLAQLIFWLEVVPGYGLLVVPFIWAYAQYAAVGTLLRTSAAPRISFVWFFAYVLLAVLAWLATRRIGAVATRPWLTAICAAFAEQVLVAVLLYVLWANSLIIIE
jgi:hypothetical protein